MGLSITSLLILTVGLASAFPYAPHVLHPAGLVPRQDTTTITPLKRLLVGGAGQIAGYNFDGSSFTPSATANVSEPGKTASWMVFKEPNLLYAVDENSNATRLFNYDRNTGTLSTEVASFNGSSGVVHLIFNADKTRLIGSSYGQGQIDVWDSSAADGKLKLLRQIPLSGAHGPDPASQTQLRAHQSLFDPTGRYLVVNDLGGDAIHVFDTLDDAFNLSARVPITPAGSGPRHGAFISVNGTAQASHYVVACELSNTLQLFTVHYGNTLSMSGLHTTPSYGPGLGPANASTAAAGELAVSHSGPVFIYVSNRLTGNATDHIARFALEAKSATDGTAQLVFKGHVSTAGLVPRMFSFSKDIDGSESVLFAGNVNGDNGLVAIKRADAAGRMSATPLGVLPNSAFSSQPADTGFGPQFVLEIPGGDAPVVGY